MNQFGRRVSYGVLGVLPALAAALFAFSIGLMQFWTPSILGVTGLAWAALTVFPTPDRTYKRILPLVTLGLISVVWFGALAKIEFGQALTDGRKDPTFWNLALLCAAALVLVGPAACAAHFVWHARRTPNNSSKPTPLRGAA